MKKSFSAAVTRLMVCYEYVFKFTSLPLLILFEHVFYMVYGSFWPEKFKRLPTNQPTPRCICSLYAHTYEFYALIKPKPTPPNHYHNSSLSSLSGLCPLRTNTPQHGDKCPAPQFPYAPPAHHSTCSRNSSSWQQSQALRKPPPQSRQTQPPQAGESTARC